MADQEANRTRLMADQEANRTRLMADQKVFHIDEKWFLICRQQPSYSPDLNILDLGFFASLQLQLPSDLNIDDDDAGPATQ